MNWRFDRFLYQKEKSLGDRILLFPLFILSLPYEGVVRTRSFFYSHGFLKTNTLPCPVISVGNITAGGAGKTPLVMAIAKGLMGRGVQVGILSRGYKRKKTAGSVVSDGETLSLSPEESGDEAFLMAQVCKEIPVLVGRDRFRNGQLALQRFGVKGLVLDDGYQHLSLHRDINILLVDSHLGFGDHHLLPRGILREPLSHLRRADLFILTKVEDLKICQPLREKIHKLHPSSPVLHSHYEAVSLVGPQEEEQGVRTLEGKRILALSGIAHSEYFSSLLRKCGMKIVRELIFPDHHHYTLKDLTSIKEKSRQVDCIVTTEKDMVKLRQLPIGGLPLRALRIEAKIWEEKEFYQRVMEIF